MRIKNSGFTAVEILVTMAVIAILIALSMPVGNSVKRSAEKSVCLANLRKIGGAFHAYLGENNYKIFPQGAQGSSQNYISYIYPYLPEDKIYRCPSTPTPVTYTSRTYKLNNTQSEKGWLYGRSYFDVADPNNTIFLFDRGDIGKRKLFVRDTVEWDYAADTSSNALYFKNYPRNHSKANDGLNLLFVNGNVRYEKYPFPAEWYYPK